MCTYSMIADHYRPYEWPWGPQNPPYSPTPNVGPLIPGTDLRWTKERWLEFERLLEAVKELDILTGQCDCEDADKDAWMDDVRELFGLPRVGHGNTIAVDSPQKVKGPEGVNVIYYVDGKKKIDRYPDASTWFITSEGTLEVVDDLNVNTIASYPDGSFHHATHA